MCNKNQLQSNRQKGNFTKDLIVAEELQETTAQSQKDISLLVDTGRGKIVIKFCPLVKGRELLQLSALGCVSNHAKYFFKSSLY